MKTKNKKMLLIIGWLLFYLYILLLSYFLFLSERYGRDFVLEEYRYNLEFLKEIKRFIRYREHLGFESFMVNILGNILAFAPLGFLLPLLNMKYRKFYVVAFISFLFSLTVESLQMYLKVGIFDVDDLLLNTMGGILGYISFRVGYYCYRKLGRKKK